MTIRRRTTGWDGQLPERIRQIRETKGLNQTDLASAVRVSQTCVWNWEKGYTRPQSDALQRLAEALGTTPDFLKKGETSNPTKDGATEVSLPLADLITRARREIAAAAGLDTSRVKIVLDYCD